MKFNQWTLGLAALGVVSLASVAQAEEKMSAVQTALSSTTISGYVDTSAHWNFAQQGNNVPPFSFNGVGKADGFNLNVVQLTLAKPLDEGEWSAGYRADLWFGPDAAGLASQSTGVADDLAIRQAYIALRAPVGNGLDIKMGVFDTIVGYETLESGNNPNYTRSYGFFIEPTTHTGILASYRFSDLISASFGVADSFGATINGRGKPNVESDKTYMGSVSLTAPTDWGWAAGSTLYVGVIDGYNSARALSGPGNETHYYVGATVATPVTGLKVGAAFDFLDAYNTTSGQGDIYVAGVYASYQATEKLSFHGRAEYLSGDLGPSDADGYEFTATVQYDLWANVISRVEFRWDHSEDFGIFGQNGNNGVSGAKNAAMLAANLIYKF